MNAGAPGSLKVGAGVALFLGTEGLGLPALANAFNPTPTFKGVLALAVGTVTAISTRAFARVSQRRTLEGALRLWWPRKLPDASLAALGVHPPYEADGQPTPYRSRSEDEDIHRALETAPITLIHGPPGAGKSRAASEAAKTALSDDVVFIPLNADALRLIADRSVEMNLPDKRICLWLDDAARFIDALDARALQSLKDLTSARGRLKVILTIRSDEWTQLLVGSGQQTDAARAVDAEAAVIELGPLQ